MANGLIYEWNCINRWGCEFGLGNLIHRSAAINDCKTMERLVTSDNDCVNLRTSGGFTPLYIAAACGHECIVAILLEAGAEKDTGSLLESPLLIASRRGYAIIVCLLLDKGANVNSVTRTDRMTPLHIAVANRRGDVVQQLLDAGADINLTNVYGHSPLDIANREGFGEIATRIVSAPAASTVVAS